MKKYLIVMASLTLVALLATGCGNVSWPTLNSIPAGEEVNFRFLISDEENDIGDFEELYIEISEIGLQQGGESGSWTTIQLKSPEPVNLVPLQGENAQLIWSGSIPASEYSKVFIYVTDIWWELKPGVDGATSNQENGGPGIQVKLPSEKLQLHFNDPFNVSADTVTNFVYDVTVFKAGKSGQYIIKPQLGRSGTGQPITEVSTATFTPISGPVGTLITVNGVSWTAEETIDAVAVGGEVAAHTLTVNSSGNLTGTITVPVLTPGAYDIIITGSSSGEQTYTDAFTVIPTATFTPISGPIATPISVIGAGWATEDTIEAVTVGGEAAVHTLTVDVFGNITGTIMVPSLEPGIKGIVITGSSSDEQIFTEAFTVIPTALFAPISGPVTTSISVIGTGWANEDTIDAVTIGSEAATHTLTVDVEGNLSGNIMVPAGLIPDIYSIDITGATSGAQTFTDAFKVTP